MNEKRTIKFRAFFKPKKEMVYLREMGASCAEGSHIIFGCEEYGHQFYDSLNDDEWELMQFTGLTDKNGKEIYEGDILQYRTPYRSTQTHTGDNIPNGSYTEPMEPAIKTTVEAVVFENGYFGIDEKENGNIVPLEWIGGDYDEEAIKDAIAYRKPEWNIWDDVEEGDLQYLLSEYKLKNLQELIEYVSGIVIIGNIYENTDLLYFKAHYFI